ncbi:hypothetical protein ACFVFT_33845 [Streptomyces tendae]|uniref:hypothetical protein n=1 Tax=Streptomyces tendae TaxID=1932 RepID=UPI0036C72A4F
MATTAVQVVTGGAPVAAEQKMAVQGLVWGRLGGSTLGASALARLHERPGEGTANIVASVLTDELRTDPEFAELMARTLHVPYSPPSQAATRRRASAGPPPPFPPPRPAVAPVQVPDAADVRNILLFGLPQTILAYIALAIAAPNGARSGVQIVILLVSAGLAAHGVWLGVSLLRRRIRSGVLIAAVVLALLALVRLALSLVGADAHLMSASG